MSSCQIIKYPAHSPALPLLFGLLAFGLALPALAFRAERSDLQVQLDPIASCAAADTVTLSGTVDSTLEVTRIFYTVGGGPEVDLCSADCGIDPNFSTVVPLSPCDNQFLVTAVDAGGTEASMGTTVTLDTQVPALSGGGTASKADGMEAVLHFTVVGNDACSGLLPATCDPVSGSTFPLGDTDVTCSATDACGNIGTIDFPVTVYCESWHWPLDEGGGVVASDLSGHDDHGAVLGTLAWTTGQQDDAIACSDTGIVEISDTDALDLQALTVAAWVRPDELGENQIFLSKDNAYELEIGKVEADVYNLRLGNVVVGQGDTPVQPGIWQHLAATWTGSLVRYYYNGQPDGMATFVGPLPATATDIGLCARSYSGVVGEAELAFQGRLDEVHVRACALSAAEIDTMVQSSLGDITPPTLSNGGPTGLLAEGVSEALLSLDTNENATCRYDTDKNVLFSDMTGTFDTTGGTSHSTLISGLSGGFYRYFVRCEDGVGNRNQEDFDIAFGADEIFVGAAGFWRFDDGSGCTAADAWGNIDGELGPTCDTNIPQWTAGQIEGALTFAGGGQLVRVPHGPVFGSTGGLTLAAWVRHDAATGFHSILDKRSGAAMGYDLYITDTSQAFLRINLATLTGNTVIADGEWHHIVGVYDGSDLLLYVDGLLDAQAAAAGQVLDVSADLHIGEHFSGAGNPLLGELDEVLVYHRALSPGEVSTLYLALQPPSPWRGEWPLRRR